MTLSTTIITFNEEKDLPRCLKSVSDIADEIIVVDSKSTDKTTSVAKKWGARVYVREFDNYANLKNYASSKAKSDWILSLDADETVSSGLANEIRSATVNGEFDAYSISRRNIIFDKFIKYSRWQPELDRHIWLWRKGKGRWVGDVHEELKVEGKIGKLSLPKIHYQYKTVSEFLRMMNRYSEIDANQRVKQGARFSPIRFVGDPIYNFFVRFFYRLGLLDGWRGFVLSYLMAVYHLEVWIKIWEKEGIDSK